LYLKDILSVYHQNQKNPFRWAKLPGLCCQAAGGDPRWAEDIAIAWFLFYLSAHIMDSIQDHDQPESWWADYSPGFALNIASGYYFTASLALTHLLKSPFPPQKTNQIIENFYRDFLYMGNGQHIGFVRDELSLNQYWQMAGAKSGIFFGLACQTGARLASEDRNTLDCFRQFGHHLGLLIQIFDDLEELERLKEGDLIVNPREFMKSLAVAYTLEVLPPEIKTQFSNAILLAVEYRNYVGEVWRMLEESGSALYLKTQIELHRKYALAFLENANPLSPAREALIGFLNL
jgi:geranylgeranyl pyrophosphate synthase